MPSEKPSSYRPCRSTFELVKLARLYLEIQQPKAALQAFDEGDAQRSP